MTTDYDELRKSFDGLKRVHDSMNQAYSALEQELERVKMRNEILTAEKKQWEMEKASQQMIIQNALTQSNSVSNQYLEENRRLKEEIKLLKSK